MLLPIALTAALVIGIIAFTAGGFIAGWMACAAFQAGDDASDRGA